MHVFFIYGIVKWYNLKFYMMPSGNILAVKLCVIETYADAEEMLSKYPKDSIFAIFSFIKV